MRRTVIPELLDIDAGTSAEIAGSLADLRFFNRYFGGSATMTAMLRKVAARTGKKHSPSSMWRAPPVTWHSPLNENW